MLQENALSMYFCFISKPEYNTRNQCCVPQGHTDPDEECITNNTYWITANYSNHYQKDEQWESFGLHTLPVDTLDKHEARRAMEKE